MRKVLALANQKGGVGKTTASVNIAAILALTEPVLLVDMDPQANSTDSVGILDTDLEYTITDVLLGEKGVKEVIIKTGFGKLDILPSNIDLSYLENNIEPKLYPDSLMKVLEELDNIYKYIIIDCPPSLGMLTINGLVAADRVLVPIKPAFFSIKGFRHLMNTINHIRDRAINPKLRVLGIFLNETQTNTIVHQRVTEFLQSEEYAKYLMNTIIPRNIKLNESQMYGKPIVAYETNSTGFEAYGNLTLEVLERWQKVIRE